MKEKYAYLRAIAKRDERIRFNVAMLKRSKAATARLFGISRERVRQIVNVK